VLYAEKCTGLLIVPEEFARKACLRSLGGCEISALGLGYFVKLALIRFLAAFLL
jgi:hypothetical protein